MVNVSSNTTRTSCLAAVLATLCSANALAESATGNATVVIQETITFNEDTAIDFGAISNADGTCTMDAAGVLSGQCLGQPDGTPGQFTVSGTAGQAVSISVGSGSTVDGVTFTPALNSSASATLNGSGETVVSVSGSLGLASATGGLKALTYSVTVNYN